VLAALPAETLDDTGETTPRNNTSVITQLAVDGRRLLFTGDAGIPALHAALDYAELSYLTSEPLDFLDVPHHGSRRNLGPTILDRLLSGQGGVTAVVSASKSAPKHPSPKITNALMRRGCEVYTTEDGQKWYHIGDVPARGWGVAQPVPPLDEADDED
jgi:beta-lactamase superfamily II metal-dependent hydrolase